MVSKKSTRQQKFESTRDKESDDVGSLTPLRRATLLRCGARFGIGDVPFVVTEFAEDGRIRMTATVGAMSLRFTPTQLFEAIRVGEAKPWGRQETVHRRLPYLDYDKLAEKEAKEVMRRIQYAMPLHRLGRISYRREGGLFQSVVAGTALAIGDPNPPHFTTVYDWLREFRRHGFDAQAYALALMLRRKRGPRNTIVAELIDSATLSLYEKGKARPTNAEILALVNERYAAYLAAEAKRAKADSSKRKGSKP